MSHYTTPVSFFFQRKKLSGVVWTSMWLSTLDISMAQLCFITQHVKKVVSDSPGLVDFVIGLVIFVLNLPDGQVLFFEEIQITEEL